MIRHNSKCKLIQSQGSTQKLYQPKSNYKLNIPKNCNSLKKLKHNYTQDHYSLQNTFRDFLIYPTQHSNILQKKKLSTKKYQLNEVSRSKFQFLLSKAQNSNQNRSNQFISSKNIANKMNKTYRNYNKQCLNISNEEKLTYFRKSAKQKECKQNLSFEEINQSKFCKITIIYQKSKKQYNYKVSTSSKLLQFLLGLVENSVGFQSTSKNILLDIFLTLKNQSCDLSFLNGNSLILRPLYQQSFKSISINSFQILKCIGSGGFSKVFLSRFKQNGKFYAMKMIDKEFITKHNKSKIVMNQRNIMKDLKHPFIIEMKFAFQSENYLIFILQYCPGGQLFQQIKKFKRMSEDMAKFYMIEILLTLQYIHDKGVLYRDFKPQNILLDIQGHVKITDFGLAKPNYYSIQDRSFSFCGSPQYMPPQMIMRKGHSLPVDFYCLGAVLYELVTGLPPFYSKNPDQIYNSTVKEEIKFPQRLKLSNQIKDLLSRLLEKEQLIRIGSTNDVGQVLSHPWFGKINKKQFLQKKIKPPINFTHIQSLSFDFEQFSDSVFLQQAKQQQKQSKFSIILKDFQYDSRQKSKQHNQLKKMIITTYGARIAQKKTIKINNFQFENTKTYQRRQTERSLDEFSKKQQKLQSLNFPKFTQNQQINRFKGKMKIKKWNKDKLYYRLNTNEEQQQQNNIQFYRV